MSMWLAGNGEPIIEIDGNYRFRASRAAVLSALTMHDFETTLSWLVFFLLQSDRPRQLPMRNALGNSAAMSWHANSTWWRRQRQPACTWMGDA